MGQEILDIVLAAVLKILGVVIGLAVTWVCTKIKVYYDTKIKSETTDKIIDNAVVAVEQMYKNLKGQEKLEKAIDMASTALKDHNIHVEATELHMLIESAVGAYNEVFFKEDKQD